MGMEQIIIIVALTWILVAVKNKIFPPKETPLQKLMKNEKVQGFAKDQGVKLLTRLLTGR